MIRIKETPTRTLLDPSRAPDIKSTPTVVDEVVDLKLESYLGSCHNPAGPPSMTLSRSGGGPQSQSSSASGVFFQGDGPNSQLNSSSSISGAPASSARPASAGHANRAAQSAANSGPSVGASSLVTDANSALSGGPYLQRSASINTESYLRLPASPMSFSSNNNISVSGSSVVDGSSVVQQPPPQGSHQDQCTGQMPQHQQGVASTATSQLNSQMGRILADQSNLLGMHKKPRLDLRQEEIFQQLMQRHDSFQPQGHSPQMQALIQQQRLLQQRHQQQQILQSMAQMQPSQMQQQQMLQSMPLLKQHVQQQQHSEQPASGMKHPYYSGICARRLMQYLYHLRQRPPVSAVAYTVFCLQLLTLFSVRFICCRICGSVIFVALGQGEDLFLILLFLFRLPVPETTFEVLPRLNKIKFDSGVIDELLFVDLPYERRLPSGLMVLEYQKATQESVYEQLRVIREGQLRIIFTPDLKILSWEFCARRHEELLPRRLVAPQLVILKIVVPVHAIAECLLQNILKLAEFFLHCSEHFDVSIFCCCFTVYDCRSTVTQLLQVAQKYQSAISESGSAGVSALDLQTNCNIMVNPVSVFVDVEEIEEIEERDQRRLLFQSLKNYPRMAAASVKLQTPKVQEMEQMVNFQVPSSDQSSLNKLMALNPGFSNNLSNNVSIPTQSGSAQTAVAMGGYRNLLRQNSVNSNHSSCQQDASCSTSGSNQPQPIPFQGSVSSIPISMQIASVDGMLRPHQQNLYQQNQQSSHTNQHPQQLAIQHVLQEMICNNAAIQQPLAGQNAKGNIGEDVRVRADSGMLGFGNSSIGMPNNAPGGIPPRMNSFKASSNNTTGVGSNAFKSRPDGPQNHQLTDLVQDIHHDFAENGVFSNEMGDLGYEWKF
ncbi:hypothetical protein ACLOJK_006157 [Asimina triloba]